MLKLSRLVTFEPLKVEQSYIPLLKALMYGISASGAQGSDSTLSICHALLKNALLLSEIAKRPAFIFDNCIPNSANWVPSCGLFMSSWQMDLEIYLKVKLFKIVFLWLILIRWGWYPLLETIFFIDKVRGYGLKPPVRKLQNHRFFAAICLSLLTYLFMTSLFERFVSQNLL